MSRNKKLRSKPRCLKSKPLRTGEVVEIECSLGFPPRCLVQITGQRGDFISYTIGECQGAFSRSMVRILRRNLAPPADWLVEELKHLRACGEIFNCPDCRRQYERKLRLLESQKSPAVGVESWH